LLGFVFLTPKPSNPAAEAGLEQDTTGRRSCGKYLFFLQRFPKHQISAILIPYLIPTINF
jgi:hypothetical protein